MVVYQESQRYKVGVSSLALSRTPSVPFLNWNNARGSPDSGRKIIRSDVALNRVGERVQFVQILVDSIRDLWWSCGINSSGEEIPKWLLCTQHLEVDRGKDRFPRQCIKHYPAAFHRNPKKLLPVSFEIQVRDEINLYPFQMGNFVKFDASINFHLQKGSPGGEEGMRLKKFSFIFLFGISRERGQKEMDWWIENWYKAWQVIRFPFWKASSSRRGNAGGEGTDGLAAREHLERNWRSVFPVSGEDLVPEP